MANEKKVLVILRGVSGAGKSSVAEMFSDGGVWPICEADQYHYTADGVYDWKPENISRAHKWCQSITRDAMQCGLRRVIVSNTSTTEKELEPYFDLAEDHGYTVVSLVVENRHGNDSIHSVPQEVRDNQEKRLRNSLVLQ